MRTAEIINELCRHQGISKAVLAKRMGAYPSCLYRKLSRDTMTFEELQKCFELMGVTVDLQFNFADGGEFTSKENHEKLIDRVEILEKKLDAADRLDEFRKKSLKDLRTLLNSAVGYTELCKSHGPKADSYLEKLKTVHERMDKTIAYALGEIVSDDYEEVGSEQIDALKGKRVLLAEDNELNGEILEEELVGYGLLVDKVDNGSKALAVVKEHDPGYYQYILMDLEMPVMDGYDATVRIRKLPNRIRANTPIIAFTAKATAESREKAFAVGMDGFLVKPINTSRLLSSLAKLL